MDMGQAAAEGRPRRKRQRSDELDTMVEGCKLGLLFMTTKLAGMPCTTWLPPPPASSSSPISPPHRVAFPPSAASAKAIVKTYIYIRLFGCKPLLFFLKSEFKNENQFAAIYIYISESFDNDRVKNYNVESSTSLHI
jgi:hypothetical protein